MDGIDFKKHLDLISSDQTGNSGSGKTNKHLQNLKTTPIFSANVWETIKSRTDISEHFQLQHGLLGLRLQTYEGSEETVSDNREKIENLLYANITDPWSAFICGSQGSGKSHTLSCLLENAIIKPNEAANLANPLAAIVFHYDKFTGYNSTQLCEAAYLRSADIPVRILVSPSNLSAMQAAYGKMPGLESDSKLEIVPLYFREKDLNISMMKTLMAVGGSDSSAPLYMEVSFK